MSDITTPKPTGIRPGMTGLAVRAQLNLISETSPIEDILDIGINPVQVQNNNPTTAALVNAIDILDRAIRPVAEFNRQTDLNNYLVFDPATGTLTFNPALAELIKRMDPIGARLARSILDTAQQLYGAIPAQFNQHLNDIPANSRLTVAPIDAPAVGNGSQATPIVLNKPDTPNGGTDGLTYGITTRTPNRVTFIRPDPDATEGGCPARIVITRQAQLVPINGTNLFQYVYYNDPNDPPNSPPRVGVQFRVQVAEGQTRDVIVAHGVNFSVLSLNRVIVRGGQPNQFVYDRSWSVPRHIPLPVAR